MFKENSSALFFCILLIKILLCWFLIYLAKCESTDIEISFFALEAGDTFSYFVPFKNLLAEGSYYFTNHLGEKIYAGRMPIYGLGYYVLTHFFSYSTTAAIYVFVQLIFETIGILSIYSMVRLKYSQLSLTPILILVVASLSTYQTLYSARLLPESFAISLFAILLLQVYLLRKNPNSYRVLFIGILFLIIVGLKPYFGIFLLPLLLEIYKIFKDAKLKKNLLLVILPFLIFCSIWTTRNYYQMNSFVPLTQKYSGYGISDSYVALRTYLGTLGENQEPWEPKAHGSFFFERKSFISIDDLYKDDYVTEDSLIELKHYFSRTQTTQSYTDKEITEKLIRYKDHYESTHPLYRISSFFSLTSNFLFHSGSYNLYIIRGAACYNSWQWGFKILQSFLYFLTLVGFAVGIFLWRDWLVSFYPFFLIIFFCGILSVIELRYFYQAFPCLLLGLGAFLADIENRLLTLKNRI